MVILLPCICSFSKQARTRIYRLTCMSRKVRKEHQILLEHKVTNLHTNDSLEHYSRNFVTTYRGKYTNTFRILKKVKTEDEFLTKKKKTRKASNTPNRKNINAVGLDEGATGITGEVLNQNRNRRSPLEVENRSARRDREVVQSVAYRTRRAERVELNGANMNIE